MRRDTGGNVGSAELVDLVFASEEEMEGISTIRSGREEFRSIAC